MYLKSLTKSTGAIGRDGAPGGKTNKMSYPARRSAIVFHACTGACGYNRPCAHQYVCKSQSCMVSNGRFIPRASYTHVDRGKTTQPTQQFVERVVSMRLKSSLVESIPQPLRRAACTMRVQLISHLKPCMTEIYLHIVARMADYIATHPYPKCPSCTETRQL